MRIYKVVKKEESPTIALNKVDFSEGFIIATSRGAAIGIIVYDLESESHIFITSFKDYFRELDISGYPNLENLMNHIKSDYEDPVEFTFVKVEP